MNNYTYLGVKGLFLDLFCGTATGTADPSVRRQRRSTFLVLDEGDLEEESGYWGDGSGYRRRRICEIVSSKRRRIHGRRFREPTKGGKGKGRGKGRRPGFVSRRGKGAGAHYAEYPDNSGFYGKGKKGKKGGKKVSKERMPLKAKERASNRINFNNPMLQPPTSLQQLSQILTPKKPGVHMNHMKQVGHGTHMDITQTSTIQKMSGRQKKPLGNNGHITRTDRRTDRETKSRQAQSQGLTSTTSQQISDIPDIIQKI